MRVVHLLLVVLLSAAQITGGQTTQSSSLQIRGAVPPTVLLDLAHSSVAVSRLGTLTGPDGRSRLLLRLHLDKGSVSIPLIARGNTNYRLTARLLASEDQPQRQFTINGKSVIPAGGGSRLMPGAASLRFLASQVLVSFSETLVAAGGRISRDGNNATVENALLIELDISAAGGAPDADVLFELVPEGN